MWPKRCSLTLQTVAVLSLWYTTTATSTIDSTSATASYLSQTVPTLASDQQTVATSTASDQQTVATSTIVDQQTVATSNIADQQTVATSIIADQQTVATSIIADQQTVTTSIIADQQTVATSKKAHQQTVVTSKIADQQTVATSKIADQKTVATSTVADQKTVATSTVADQQTVATSTVADQQTVATSTIADQQTVATSTIADQQTVATSIIADQQTVATSKKAHQQTIATSVIADQQTVATSTVADQQTVATSTVADQQTVATSTIADQQTVATSIIADQQTVATSSVADQQTVATSTITDEQAVTTNVGPSVAPSSTPFAVPSSHSYLTPSLTPYLAQSSHSHLAPSSNRHESPSSDLYIAPSSEVYIALTSYPDESIQTPVETGSTPVSLIKETSSLPLSIATSAAYTLSPILSGADVTTTNTFSANFSDYIATSSVDSNAAHKTTIQPDVKVSTSKPSIITSKPLPTAPPQYQIKPNITFPFKLKYDGHFNKDLKDPATDLYKKTETSYTDRIKPAYENVTGFQNFTITRFWEGSIGVDYDVVIAYSMTDDEFLDEMHSIVLPALRESREINITFLNETFKESVQQALEVLADACHTSSGLCQDDFQCMLDTSSKPVCRPLCTNPEAIGKCQNGGKCVQDAPKNFICKCPQDKAFLYGGEYCEVQEEKLGLKKDYIIAIACGAGGGIILILIVVIIILIQRRRRNSKGDKDDASQLSYKSVKDSEDGLHQSPKGNRNSALMDYSNPAFRRLEQRTEEMRLQYRASAGSSQTPKSGPVNLRYVQGNPSHPRQIGQEAETARLGGSLNQLSSDRASNRGQQSALYPQLPRIIPSADYVEIEDHYSKSIMYQPTKAMHPLPEFQQGRPLHSPMDTKVYDYTRRVEPRANSGHSQAGSGFHDPAYQNSIERRNQIEDPYSIRRPHIVTQKRFP